MKRYSDDAISSCLRRLQSCCISFRSRDEIEAYTANEYVQSELENGAVPKQFLFDASFSLASVVGEATTQQTLLSRIMYGDSP